MNRKANWFAIAWTVLVTGYLLFGPVYASRSTTIGADGSTSESSGTRTLIAVNGPRVLILLAIPLLLVALPLLATNPVRRQQIGVACALILFALALVSSIGFFYYPCAIALLLAATATKVEPVNPAR